MMNDAFWQIGVALLILVAVAALLLCRRKAGGKATARALQQRLSRYENSHPFFFRVMTTFLQTHSLAELEEIPDARRALENLQLIQAPSSQGPHREVLKLGDSDSGLVETEAAMLTLMRTLYFNERLSEDLPQAWQLDIDRFLEALTG